MKKLILLLLLLPCLVRAQKTYSTTTPAGTSPTTLTFRYSGTDSLRDVWAFYNGAYNLLYSGAQQNRSFLPIINPTFTGLLSGGNATGTSYNENIRLYRSNLNFSTLVLGAVPGSTSGFAPGQWSIVSSPPGTTNLRALIFDYNGTQPFRFDTAGKFSAVSIYQNGNQVLDVTNLENTVDNSTSKATTGQAVTNYVATSAASQTLQAVTARGNTTTKSMYALDSLWGNNLRIKQGIYLSDSIKTQLDSLVIFDNSIGAGTGSTGNPFRYTTLLSKWWNAFEFNKSIAGKTVQRVTAGDSSLVDRLPIMPKYLASGTRRYIIIGGPENDCDLGFTVSGYTSALTTIVNYLTGTLNWPKSKIILRTGNIIGANSFGHNRADMIPFVTAGVAAARSLGIDYVNAFDYSTQNGNNLLLTGDSIHPNNLGHYQIAQAIAYKIYGTKINGPTHFVGKSFVGALPTVTGVDAFYSVVNPIAPLEGVYSAAGYLRRTIEDKSQGTNLKKFEELVQNGEYNLSRISDDGGTRTNFFKIKSAGNTSFGVNAQIGIALTPSAAAISLGLAGTVNPFISFYNATGGTDLKTSDMYLDNGGNFIWRSLTDAGTPSTYLQFSKTAGVVTGMAVTPNTTIAGTLRLGTYTAIPSITPAFSVGNSSGGLETTFTGTTYVRQFWRDASQTTDKKIYQLLNNNQHFTIARVNDLNTISTNYLDISDGGNTLFTNKFQLGADNTLSAAAVTAGTASSKPYLGFWNTSGSTDVKGYDQYLDTNGDFIFRSIADNSAASSYAKYTRTAGTVISYQLATPVSIGSTLAAPASSTILDITSTTKGVRLPSLTGAQQNAISSPAPGLLIYNTDSARHTFYDGSNWKKYYTRSDVITLADSRYIRTGSAVTSVATGYGLTGGTITTTGTLLTDSTKTLNKVSATPQIITAPVNFESAVKFDQGISFYKQVASVSIPSGYGYIWSATGNPGQFSFQTATGNAFYLGPQPSTSGWSITSNLSAFNTYVLPDKGGTSTFAMLSDIVSRTPTLVSSSFTMSLNSDYLNTSATQYTLTLPTTTSFTSDGSKIITVLATGTGGAIIRVPSGYSMQSGSSFATTTGTGGATLTQGQKVQLIPVGSNSYYLQPLNGSVTLY